MAESQENARVGALPGLSLDDFSAAVRALVELRDTGKFLVFLGRRALFRIVGSTDDFRSRLAEYRKGEVKLQDAEKAIREIRNYCNMWRTFQDEKQIVSFLQSNVFSGAVGKLKGDAKKEFRQQQEEKIRLVSHQLFTDAMRQRLARLETATSACVEDLDAEVVRQRSDDLRGQKIPEPFLRLRLRYSVEDECVAFPWMWSFPWNASVPAGIRSFELECDESDIDLLMTRLTEAKKVLLETRSGPTG